MIALAEECLVFQTHDGEALPCSADMISVEVLGDSASLFDPEFLRHAAAAVFHYFRKEMGRDTVTIAEFSEALEKILRGFSLGSPPPAAPAPPAEASPLVLNSDLCRLVAEADRGGELFFFPRLRDELRAQLRQSPRMLCFQGLRGCVKQLTGARRWNGRCQTLRDHIVDFLRTCMSREGDHNQCALVVN